MQTISTTTFVGLALIRAIKNAYPTINPVFSNTLQYPLPELDERGDSNDIISKSSFPLFAWNRSALRPSELGSRGVRFSTYGSQPSFPNSDVLKYRIAHCEFDFNFLLVDKDIATIESFEIDFLSKEGLGRITEIHVDLSSANIGTLKYYVTWNLQLGSFDANVDENSYISISGSAKVMGWFVSLYGETPIINNINLSLKDSVQVLETDKIS